jgi:hypothetical protein
MAVESILEHVLKLAQSLVELRVRVYGGWVSADGRSTEMRDMLGKAIRGSGSSRRSKSARVFVEIADGPLAAPHVRFPSTFRLLPWRATLRQADRDLVGCHFSDTNCAKVKDLLAWAAGRCPESPRCGQRSQATFSVETQKLVDSMIVTDALVAHTMGAAAVIGVSRDDDIVPALMSVGALGGVAQWLRYGQANPSDYDSLLRSVGVEIFDYEPFR